MTDAMGELKPTAVLWNIGFHLLNHDFKPTVCRQRYNPTKKNCGDYKQMVKLATSQMLGAGIESVVWKATNYLCEDRQVVGFPKTKEALLKWHVEEDRPALERACRKECPQYDAAGLTCYDWFFDAHTTERLFAESQDALTELRAEVGGGIYMLDSFNLSKNCCDRGCEEETTDGEHYAGLDSQLLVEFAKILADHPKQEFSHSSSLPDAPFGETDGPVVSEPQNEGQRHMIQRAWTRLKGLARRR
jgi:hypothetical protein